MRIRIVPWKPLAALFVLVATTGSAGPLSDLLRGRQSGIDAVLAKHPGDLAADAKKELTDVLSSAIDFPEMARQSLGDAWADKTADQRESFVTSFRRLVQATWVRKPDVYRADRIEYGSEAVEGTNGSVTTVVNRTDALTDVVYVFRRVGDKWLVVDYSIDGVSAVGNYRSQFASILKKRGWDGLLSRLDQRIQKLEAEGGDTE